jgi:hypothetical protein
MAVSDWRGDVWLGVAVRRGNAVMAVLVTESLGEARSG